MAEGVVAIGATVPRSPGSQCRRCELCRGQAWFTKASTANALRAAAGAGITWICERCLDRVPAKPDAEVLAYSPEQIAELHAAGIDDSAEQLQAKVQEFGAAMLRRKR